MLALLNTTNTVRCLVDDWWWRAPWRLTLSAKVMIGEQRRRGGRGRTREGEDSNNMGRMTTTVPFLKQSSGNKKA